VPPVFYLFIYPTRPLNKTKKKKPLGRGGKVKRPGIRADSNRLNRTDQKKKRNEPANVALEEKPKGTVKNERGEEKRKKQTRRLRRRGT